MRPCWDTKGNGICQTCGRKGPANIQTLRALGWHHGAGVTIGGSGYEALLCPNCAKDEKRRKTTRSTLEQDQLPIDWTQCEVAPRSQGGHTR